MGATLSTLVGTRVGTMVGVHVGAFVGEAVGVWEGMLVGALLGALVVFPSFRLNVPSKLTETNFSVVLSVRLMCEGLS